MSVADSAFLSLGYLLFDGYYLVDLDFQFSVMGEIPSSIDALKVSPVLILVLSSSPCINLTDIHLCDPSSLRVTGTESSKRLATLCYTSIYPVHSASRSRRTQRSVQIRAFCFQTCADPCPVRLLLLAGPRQDDDAGGEWAASSGPVVGPSLGPVAERDQGYRPRGLGRRAGHPRESR